MVTREEVAKRAGVTVSAVSRTMNGRGYVAKEKKESILKAVKELGYRPNPLSNSLKNKQTYQLCFFCVDIYNSFYMDMYNYMADYAEKMGYTLFLLTTFNVERFKDMLLDGILVENDGVAFDLQQLVGECFFPPMVGASFGSSGICTKKVPYVDVDTYVAMEMGLTYLMKKGHKKIAYGTPYNTKGNELSQTRNVAYENKMTPVYGKNIEKYIFVSEDNKEIKNERKLFNKEFFFEEGMKGADEFVSRKCDATAIICFNDEYALGMISRFKHIGYRIPEDISIMGIDGIHNRKYTTPLLSSVSLNVKEQAETCVQVLLKMIEGKKVSYRTTITPYLLEGESVMDNISKN